jgi:LPS sulfotransferase NodH
MATMAFKEILFWSKLYTRRIARNAHNKIMYHYLKSKQTIIPVFVVAMPRTGSSLLGTYLKSLHGVEIRGEILNPWLFIGMRKNCSNKNKVFKHMRQSLLNKKNAHICVAKLLKEQMERYGVEIRDLINEFPTAKFILMYRNNLGEQFYSYKRAQMTQEWYKKDEEKQKIKKIYIDTGEFIDYCRTIETFYNGILSQLSKRKYIMIAYEQLVENGQSTIDKTVSKFLGVKSGKIKTKLKKQNLEPLQNVIENYDHAKDLLKRKLIFDDKLQ